MPKIVPRDRHSTIEFDIRDADEDISKVAPRNRTDSDDILKHLTSVAEIQTSKWNTLVCESKYPDGTTRRQRRQFRYRYSSGRPQDQEPQGVL